MRHFNGREVELLAPCGTFEIFQELLDSGADAFYCGGKILNMRLHRKEYNFTNDELKEAVKIAHNNGKKLYVTVNNLFNSKDIEQAVDFLHFLKNVQVDAILIQDFSVLELLKEDNLDITVHASVMMNVHNMQTIKALQRHGISRVVASREMTLAEVKIMHLQTGMEFEYFAHGDMCIAHGSQCHYSGMIFGKSSNRGMCMKPCRWYFDIKQGENIYKTETGYPMAVKDMCMYDNIHHMIDANITSFKLEGRMRDTVYLKNLVQAYSKQIQSYIDDPLGFNPYNGYESLFKNRKRDFSTAYAFSKPGLANINGRFEGTGLFYSTGKVFSNPVEETEISSASIEKAKVNLTVADDFVTKQSPMQITVLVNNVEQAKVCFEEKVGIVYLNTETFAPDLPFSIKDIKLLAEQKGETKIYLKTPKMMYSLDFENFKNAIEQLFEEVDGLLVSNLGAVSVFKNYKIDIVGDYSLNIYNKKSAEFYKKEGLNRLTMSLELNSKDARGLLCNCYTPVEVIVYGKPSVMYLEHDLFENIPEEKRTKENLYLVDNEGLEHPVYKDCFGRNHLTLSKDLSLIPLIPELQALGVGYFRIDGLTYTAEELRNILKAVANMDYDLMNKVGLTLGSFNY